MSFDAVVWAWEQDVDAAELLVLLSLADIANENGSLYASYGYIAKRCRRSERHARSVVAGMEGRLLSREERPGRTDLITLLIPEEFTVRRKGAADLETGKRGRPRKTPAIHEENPGNLALKLVTQFADEPLEEPKKEPRESLTRAWMEKFPEWYALYPKHCARGRAEKAWRDIPEVLRKRGQTFDDLMFLTSRFAASVGPDKKYIPHPASWLNAEGWNDEIITEGQADAHRRPERADRVQQRTATLFLPMAAGAQEALNRRRGRWGID